MKKSALLIVPALFFLGCASHPLDPQMSMTPPKYVEEIPSLEKESLNNPGSLFSNGDNLFSDTKAKQVNDIVTIVITEQISQSSQATKKLNEANTDNGGFIDASISGSANIGGREINMGKTGLTFNLPSMNSRRSFQGGGTQQRDEKFKTTITARIIKILANGNYYIYGTREILVDGQKQIVKLSGVIRPEDISPDNTIDSKYIADAKIAYETQGDIKRSTQRHWLAKFWSAISPW